MWFLAIILQFWEYFRGDVSPISGAPIRVKNYKAAWSYQQWWPFYPTVANLQEQPGDQFHLPAVLPLPRLHPPNPQKFPNPWLVTLVAKLRIANMLLYNNLVELLNKLEYLTGGKGRFSKFPQCIRISTEVSNCFLRLHPKSCPILLVLWDDYCWTKIPETEVWIPAVLWKLAWVILGHSQPNLRGSCREDIMEKGKMM